MEVTGNRLVKTFFTLVTLLLLYGLPSAQTLEQIKATTDSILHSTDSLSKTTDVIAEDLLFSTIKTAFDETKISRRAAEIADSLFTITLYSEAILEYRRAKFYSENDSYNDSLTYKIALSLSFQKKYYKANREIKYLYKEFTFLQLANRGDSFAPLYIKNLLIQKEYTRVQVTLDELFLDTQYNGNHFKELKNYYEFSTIVLGRVAEVSHLENDEAKIELQNYLDTSTKNPTTTYYLSTFLPGSGYMYNGDYKMGTISALVNIPLAIYLGTRITNVADGIIDEDKGKIVTNSLDFVLIYTFVFSRYWKGARNEAVKQSHEINRTLRENTVTELERIYEIH